MPARIHPTALIDSQAQLGDDVEIGPFVTIEGPATIGDGCVLHAKCSLLGEVTLGPRTTIGHSAVIGGYPQDLAFQATPRSSVAIGADNVIRELCTIHRGTAEGSVTRLGDHNYLMAGVHLAHNVILGSHTILANNVLLGGYAQVEDRVFIGGGSVFHQHVRVGRLAMVQGVSAFSKDIPPYTLAAERNTVAGLNIVGLRRAGFKPEPRRELQAAFRLIFRRGLNTKQALATAAAQPWSPEAQAFFDFIATSQRGICAYIRGAKTETDAGD